MVMNSSCIAASIRRIASHSRFLRSMSERALAEASAREAQAKDHEEMKQAQANLDNAEERARKELQG